MAPVQKGSAAGQLRIHAKNSRAVSGSLNGRIGEAPGRTESGGTLRPNGKGFITAKAVEARAKIRIHNEVPDEGRGRDGSRHGEDFKSNLIDKVI